MTKVIICSTHIKTVIYISREFGSNNEEEIDYEIPDVTDWSCEQIYAYFEEKHNGGALALKERVRFCIKMSFKNCIEYHLIKF